MKTKHFRLGLVLSVLMVLAAACGFSFTTANFASAEMAKDPEGSQPATTFAPDDTFYAVIELDNAPEDTQVRAEWTAVDVAGEEPNTPIDSAQLSTGSGQLHFSLENNTPWPEGEYKVDLFIEDELERTLEFEVQ